jgi:hypothetical protein
MMVARGSRNALIGYVLSVKMSPSFVCRELIQIDSDVYPVLEL